VASNGLAQRFTAVAEAAWKNQLFQKPAIDIGKALSATAINDFWVGWRSQESVWRARVVPLS